MSLGRNVNRRTLESDSLAVEAFIAGISKNDLTLVDTMDTYCPQTTTSVINSCIFTHHINVAYA